MLVTAAGSSILLGVWVYLTWRALQTYRWPMAEARIVRSESVWRVRKGRRMVEPRVVYVYRVGERWHRGNRRHRFGTWWVAWHWWARLLLRPYPRGAVVTIRYNPDAPAESALKPGTVWPGHLLVLCILVVVSAASVWTAG